MTFFKWSRTAASNGTADGTCPFPEGMAASGLNDGARGMMAAAAKYRDDVAGAIVTGGTLNAYTVSSFQAFSSFATLNGQMIAFAPHVTNGATVTLNVDGLGAKPLRSAPGVELLAGALILGASYTAIYNNTDAAFYLRDYTNTVIAAGQVITASIADANVTYAKIQNVAAARLLGNPTGGAAAPSEIALGAGMSFVGGALLSTLDPALLPGFLSGLTLSAAGGVATFGIAAGLANDTNSGGLMTLPAAFTKTTSAWAVGSGNGALDAATIAINTWYHVYEIKRPDTGVVDIAVSTNAAAPTTGGNIPAAYTLSRRIGSIKTDGAGQWIKFTQTGDTFIWDTAVQESSGIATTAARVSKTLSGVPTGIVVAALFRASINSASAVGMLFTALGIESDQAATTLTFCDIATNGSPGSGAFEKLTNTSAQIGVRSSGTAAVHSLSTTGWKDTRGK